MSGLCTPGVARTSRGPSTGIPHSSRDSGPANAASVHVFDEASGIEYIVVGVSPRATLSRRHRRRCAASMRRPASEAPGCGSRVGARGAGRCPGGAGCDRRTEDGRPRVELQAARPPATTSACLGGVGGDSVRVTCRWHSSSPGCISYDGTLTDGSAIDLGAPGGTVVCGRRSIGQRSTGPSGSGNCASSTAGRRR